MLKIKSKWKYVGVDANGDQYQHQVKAKYIESRKWVSNLSIWGCDFSGLKKGKLYKIINNGTELKEV